MEKTEVISCHKPIQRDWRVFLESSICRKLLESNIKDAKFIVHNFLDFDGKTRLMDRSSPTQESFSQSQEIALDVLRGFYAKIALGGQNPEKSFRDILGGWRLYLSDLEWMDVIYE